VHADLLDYEPAPEKFDLAVMLYLQVPAAERTTVLRRAAVALAPGGSLVVVAHDRSNIEHGWGGPQDPSVLYGADDVVADLGGGLVIERAGIVERPVEQADGEKIALDLLVRARITSAA
jgi:hypothetical protein